MKSDYDFPSDALRFLKVLGKDPGETRIRLIPNPKSDGIGVAKGSFKEAILKSWERRKAGIYVVINDGGDDDASITQCRALFVEHDDLSIEEQAKCWQGKMPEPTIQVHTGGKSIHQYWVLKEPMQKENWIILQKKLITALASDPNNCNPSRVMRLPGYTYYNRKGQTGPAASIYGCSEKIYTVAELEGYLSAVQADPLLKTASSYRQAELKTEWTAVRPCPICGRDLDDKCRMTKDETFIQCHLGDTFMPPNGIRGEVLRGHDGQKWKRKTRTSNVYGDAIGFSLVQEENNISPVRSKSELISFVEAEYGERLAWNELKRRLEIDGSPIEDINLMHCSLAEHYGIHQRSSNVVDAFLYVGKKSSYNPVTEFLQKTEKEVPKCNLDEIGAIYLGLKTPIESRAFGVHLLAAVYRAFHPGFAYDQILIMRGPQGVGKTRTIKILSGSPDHYISSTVVQQEKDFLIQLGSTWHCELEEIDGHIDSRHEAHLKALISRHTDNYRAPYASSVEDRPRRSVFWGTTNQDKLLVDSTGNRRMMIIDLHQSVDLERLQSDLSPIWSAVMREYRAGNQPRMTAEEIAKIAGIASASFKEDPWLGIIESSIEGTPVVFEHFIQRSVLGIEVRNLKGGRSGETRRIHDCLRYLGYQRYEYQINGLDKLNLGWGKRARGAWFAPQIAPTSNGQEIAALLRSAGKDLPTGPAFKMLDPDGHPPF